MGPIGAAPIRQKEPHRRIACIVRHGAPCHRCLVAALSAVLLLVMVACGRVPAANTTPAAPGATDLPPSTEIVPTQPLPATDNPTTDSGVVLTPTATLSAVILPAATSPATAQAGAPFTSPRYGYTVVLPCCWIALPAPATAVEAALSDLAEGTGDPLYDNLLDELREDENSVSLEYIAYLPDENGLPEAQLTVSVVPAQRLTLETYMDGVTAEIGGIGATAVVTGQIEPALGPGDTPAGVIEYTTVYEADPLHGLQIAFFTASGDHMIVLTFTTNAGKFADLRAEFMHIARSVTFDG